MLVARSGLEKRGRYNGRIKQFSEQVAPLEPSWSGSFSAWHSELVAATL